jgi:hypothetical protein
MLISNFWQKTKGIDVMLLNSEGFAALHAAAGGARATVCTAITQHASDRVPSFGM